MATADSDSSLCEGQQSSCLMHRSQQPPASRVYTPAHCPAALPGTLSHLVLSLESQSCPGLQVRANGLIVFIPKFGIEGVVHLNPKEDKKGPPAAGSFKLDEERQTVASPDGSLAFTVFDKVGQPQPFMSSSELLFTRPNPSSSLEARQGRQDCGQPQQLPCLHCL